MVTVEARKPWNDTRIDVKTGETLIFTVFPGQWHDAGISSTAGGYNPPLGLRPWGWLLCNQKGRWFELTGAVGRTITTAFAIGDGGRIRMPATGRLYLFANDVPLFYWNNHGALSVEIKQVSP